MKQEEQVKTSEILYKTPEDSDNANVSFVSNDTDTSGCVKNPPWCERWSAAVEEFKQFKQQMQEQLELEQLAIEKRVQLELEKIRLEEMERKQKIEQLEKRVKLLMVPARPPPLQNIQNTMRQSSSSREQLDAMDKEWKRAFDQAFNKLRFPGACNRFLVCHDNKLQSDPKEGPDDDADSPVEEFSSCEAVGDQDDQEEDADKDDLVRSDDEDPVEDCDDKTYGSEEEHKGKDFSAIENSLRVVSMNVETTKEHMAEVDKGLKELRRDIDDELENELEDQSRKLQVYKDDIMRVGKLECSRIKHLQAVLWSLEPDVDWTSFWEEPKARMTLCQPWGM